MEDQEILVQLNKIFNRVLKKQNISVSADTMPSNIDGWDSLTHMFIIDNIEKHFAIKFKLMDVMKFNNVGDIISCIKTKIHA